MQQPIFKDKFKIEVLTPAGIKFYIYDQAKKKTLHDLEEEIKKEHGTFITLKTEKIK